MGTVYGQDLRGVLENILKKKVADYYFDNTTLTYGVSCSDGSMHRLMHYEVEPVALAMYEATMPPAPRPSFGSKEMELHRCEQELEHTLTAALAIQTKIDELKKELENGTD